MVVDLKLLGAHCLASLCICIKILTSPIVWLASYVDKKEKIAAKPVVE